MSELKALLFDVDGTLADTERDGHRPAFNAAFREFGLDWEWDVELYGQLLEVTGGKERMKFYVERFRPDYRKPADFDDLVAELHKAKTRHYTELLAQGGIPLRPGVKRLLEEARAAGLILAVATTTTPENVTALLKHSLAADGADWFAVIAAGDIVPAKKPAPDIYLWALQQLGLAPEQCLAFEDSENGIRAARGAGLKTVVTVNEYTRDHDFTGALAVLSDLGEPGAPYRRIDAADEAGYVDVARLKGWLAA
ncbi:HAD superfamily hydrolase (TIGR01509 family) [Sulfuritortus calidifontis]|uniref:HAD superfamily hydrolase (TIGR01509 family) n=1 Tax=Sulfuritortus calidifontis TaxID=1914471 RepID=A0A4R3K0I1_9PROT|nr:HAD family hydrolase [Sulfuritortus calidifontis]TCS73441.1 HAD superfamily hydrolase (TIGR01509 family) [Sulfuritortus calidifontis]